MAVRSSGTGVIVSLVIFIVITVLLLVMTIVFYKGQSEAVQAEASATAELDKWAAPSERNSDAFRRFVEQASQNRQSVAGYLASRNDRMSEYVVGAPGSSLDEIQAEMETLGIPAGTDVKSGILDLNRTMNSRRSELESSLRRQNDLEEELARAEQEISQAEREHRERLDEVEGVIAAYREEAEQFREDLGDTIARLDEARATLRERYEGEVDDVLAQLDAARGGERRLRDRLEDLEVRFENLRLQATSPDLLVDAQIIDVDGATGTVSINRGRRDRVVLGMTFEVYDSAAAIRVDPETGEPVRGKASIKVTNVGDTVSTGAIVRSVPGRTLVRNDVVANAVYDPDRIFRFMVHGKFDVDGDGRPTDAEADFLRSLIVDWGGEVVDGDDVPGDLDFLVLGKQPPVPAPLGLSPTPLEIDTYSQRRFAVVRYEELEQQARDARIPVLNDNRFFILIGQYR